MLICWFANGFDFGCVAEIGLLLGAVGVVLGRVGAPKALAALPVISQHLLGILRFHT